MTFKHHAAEINKVEAEVHDRVQTAFLEASQTLGDDYAEDDAAGNFLPGNRAFVEALTQAFSEHDLETSLYSENVYTIADHGTGLYKRQISGTARDKKQELK